jgi:7-carboxy-7-deazaguanine synthase
MSIPEILEKIAEFGCKNILLTGGEPLLQRGSIELCERPIESEYSLSIETHGEISISKVPQAARIIMDIKTPSSGMSRGGFKKNLPHLKPQDEIKFVIASKEDYEWAKDLVESRSLPPVTVLFSAAQKASNSPGKIAPVELRWLAEKILEDRLPVRLQIQLHKLIWGPDLRGV